MLRGFDEVVDGGADRVIRMAESEQQHRHAMEERALSGAIASETRGQYLAVVICVLLIGATIALVLLGQPKVALLFGGVTLVALVTAFLRGRDKSKKSRSHDEEDD